MENSTHMMQISKGAAKNRGRVQNYEVSWLAFVDRMSNPQVDHDITSAQYEAFGKKAKGDTKAAAGFLFAGHCTGGVRHKDNVESRSMINLDIDDVELDIDEIYTQIKMGAIEDLEFEAFAHTTRSHMPRNPRLRIMIPLSKQVHDEDEYNAVARLVAERIDPSMEMFDSCSFRFAQMMYLPSRSSDQEFIAKRFSGSLCDPEMILEECDGDWRDLSQLPRAQSETIKIRKAIHALGGGSGAGMISDPTLKDNIIGAFCRAYDVEDAMHIFMPGVYGPSEGRGAAANRFTYTAGSSVNGAVILNGTHLYSHHATDPLREQAFNAFDLVRAHRFGHLDDPGAPYSTPAELDSHRAMVQFAHRDPRVKQQIAASRITADAFDI